MIFDAQNVALHTIGSDPLQRLQDTHTVVFMNDHVVQPQFGLSERIVRVAGSSRDPAAENVRGRQDDETGRRLPEACVQIGGYDGDLPGLQWRDRAPALERHGRIDIVATQQA